MRIKMFFIIVAFLIFHAPVSRAQLLDCSAVIDMGCTGGIYSGSTADGKSDVPKYSCSSWTETGKEVVFTVTPDLPGNIIATLISTPGDINVFILGSCNENDCLAWGPVAAVASGPPQTYYIVVDGYGGYSGTFTLQIYAQCSITATPTVMPTSTPTLTPTSILTPTPSSTSSLSPTPMLTATPSSTPFEVPMSASGSLVLLLTSIFMIATASRLRSSHQKT
jgi:hypothetical protein